MESIRFIPNDAATYNQVVHGGLPDFGDLSIVTKDNATKGGHPSACLTFTVQLPDGKRHRAQTVVTVRNLLDALHAVMGQYSHLANAKEPDVNIGEVVHGKHRGVGYDAVGVAQVWLLTFEGYPGMVGIARTKEDMKATAEGLINQALES